MFKTIREFPKQSKKTTYDRNQYLKVIVYSRGPRKLKTF